VDNDRLDTPRKPAPIELSKIYDYLANTFHDFGSKTWVEAENVNTLDEVPNSTWFTSRHAVQPMSIEALRRGPNTCAGPQGVLTIVKGKTQGVTPGFNVVDARGDEYLIKFDWKDASEAGSAAEVVITKLLYAMGYNVPENYIAYIRPNDLVIRPGTKIKDRFGDYSPLTKGKVNRLLRQVARMRDGRIRVLASRYIAGEILGPSRYYETRTDDPNDVVAHENRRELRGLRLISAWLNNYDARAANTLGTWVESEGKHYVLHYLIDFGSAMGAGYWDNLNPVAGIQYGLDFDSMKRSAVTFGLVPPKYRTAHWPNYKKYPAVGRYQAEPFDPGKWVGTYPNSAFVRMTDRDGFWAAKIIMSFNPEELRAIASMVEFSDPKTGDYFYNVLLARQRKCGEVFLNRMNPIDAFRVTSAGLECENLSEKYGLGPSGAKYRVRWFLYDNSQHVISYLDDPVTCDRPVFPLPGLDLSQDAQRLLGAEIQTLHPKQPNWGKYVRVVLKPEKDTLRIIGIERESRALGPIPKR
jgi:hypothetical protein